MSNTAETTDTNGAGLSALRPLTGSLTDRTPGQECGNCRHYEYGPKKMKIEGKRLGRCNYDKPILLHDGPYRQFEDNGTNCPCWAANKLI